jgi:hypothetical protein
MFRGGAISNLVAVVRTPTPDGAIRFQRTRVLVSGGDGHDVTQAADLHGQQRLARRASIPQLSMGVVAPAPNGAVGDDDAREVVAG